jgi:hypothetical protein
VPNIEKNNFRYAVGEQVKAHGRCRDAEKETIRYGTLGTIIEILQTEDSYYLRVEWETGQTSANHMPRGFWSANMYDVYT